MMIVAQEGQFNQAIQRQMTEEQMVAIRNFHDGYFDGFRLRGNKVLEVYLRTTNEEPFTLVLHGVRAIRISGVMAGNIILDLVLRNASQMNAGDMQEVYGLAPDSPQASALLASATEQALQLIELNPSYGAEGLFLFEKFEIESGDRVVDSPRE